MNPYGDVNQVNPYGNTNPYGDASQINPYGDASQINPYGEASQVNPYGEASQVNPYGEASQVNPYGDVSQINPYGDVNQVNPYGDTSQVSPYGVETQGDLDFSYTDMSQSSRQYVNMTYEKSRRFLQGEIGKNKGGYVDKPMVRQWPLILTAVPVIYSLIVLTELKVTFGMIVCVIAIIGVGILGTMNARKVTIDYNEKFCGDLALYLVIMFFIKMGGIWYCFVASLGFLVWLVIKKTKEETQNKNLTKELNEGPRKAIVSFAIYLNIMLLLSTLFLR